MARAADPAVARDAARRIVVTLREAGGGGGGGHVAYFAGGCVRDELLGLRPTDYDVATDAPPARVRELFRGTHEVGEAFGVVLVPIDRAVVEVATFRSDGVYSDKRRPDAVTFSDARNDAQRRDFTINALFLDPLEHASGTDTSSPQGGKVIDFVNGLADLRGKVLRAVGDPNQRLAEDHLRALRAVRFTARLGFTLDPATAAAITTHASQLAGISRERIGQEIARMMDHPSRAVAAALMQRLALDAPALGEAAGSAPTTILAGMTSPRPTLAVCLAAWALDRIAPSGSIEPKIATRLVTAWRKSLCLSNTDRDFLADLLRVHHALIAAWAGLSLPRQKRLAAEPCFADALTLLEAQSPDRAATVLVRVRELHAHGPGIAPPPFVNGDDLVLLGFPPGPAFKRILDRVYDAQLEGRFAVREQALAYARELARDSGV